MKITKPIALQLYSVRFLLEEDFYGTLKQIADMGYQGVEFAGFFDKKASEIKKVLDELNLKPVSSHISLYNFLEDFDKEVAYHKELGIKYCVVPWSNPEQRPGHEDWGKTREQYIEVGRKLKENGIELFYHNHDFEFEKVDGEYILDYMFRDVPSEYLNPQLDICWVKVGGADPTEYIKKYSNRMKTLHLKDFIKTSDRNDNLYALIDSKGKDDKKVEQNEEDTFDFVPVGQGQQDMPSILAAAEESTIEWHIVEQDRSSKHSLMDSIKLSLDYLNQFKV